MSEPRWYTVDDHPVVIQPGPDGTEHARVIDLRTGAFVTDDGYLTVVASGGKSVEELAPEPFARLVAALRQVASDDLQASRLVWEQGDGYQVLRMEHEGVVYRVQPEDDGWSLMVNGQQVAHPRGLAAAVVEGGRPPGRVARFARSHRHGLARHRSGRP